MIRFGHYPLWPRPPSRLARPNGQARLSTKLPTRSLHRGTIAQKCKAESKDPTRRVFAVIDQNDYMVTRLYRIQPKRRACQHEVPRSQ